MKLPLSGRKEDYHKLLRKAAHQAQAGRELAVYDQETGLFAPWFFGLRCPEECYRAVRYRRPLTLLLIEVRTEGDNFDSAVDQVVRSLKAGRRSDVPSHLGAGRFAVLLPETDAAAAEALTVRLEALAPGILTGISSHPYDGGNQKQLIVSAEQRLNSGNRLAA